MKCAGHNNMLPVIRAVIDPWIQCLLYNHPDQDMNLDETMVSIPSSSVSSRYKLGVGDGTTTLPRDLLVLIMLFSVF